MRRPEGHVFWFEKRWPAYVLGAIGVAFLLLFLWLERGP